MALSNSEQNHCRSELKKYFLSKRANLSPTTETAILAALNQQGIVFNPKLKDMGKRLLEIVAKQLDEEQFKKALDEWANLYQQNVVEAGSLGKKLYAAYPKGILRCLREQEQADNIWCDDIDIQVCLGGLIITSENNVAQDNIAQGNIAQGNIAQGNIAQGGHYILPPVSLLDEHALEDRIKAVRANKKIQDDIIHLYIPLAYHGHWRLAKINLVHHKVKEAVLWDSLNNPNLQDHPAFAAFKQQVKQVQPEIADDKFQCLAANIQSNTWSCGDYVMQEAIKQIDKKHFISQELLTLRDANDPRALRAAVVKQIKRNDPILRLSREERVSFFSRELPEHLQENKGIRDNFDHLLAEKFSKLINNGDTKEDEKLLFERAREQAYDELKDRLPKPNKL